MSYQVPRRRARILAVLWMMMGSTLQMAAARGGQLIGTVADDASGAAIPARIYLRDESGEWLFVKSATSDGTAMPYREQWVPMPHAVEKHTTVSAHSFTVDLPPGTYTIEVERGKEYHTLTEQITIGSEPLERTFRLKRWVNMAERGWYSGETHVHRRIGELANVMAAEDLNVAFPVTFWTIRSDQPPDLRPSSLRSQGPSPFGPREDLGTEPIVVDATRVIVPRNTEYEIFSIGEQRHTLGALFLLNHRSRFTDTAPPIAAIAKQAHAEGALLDLDKHSWPWSMMLVPVAEIDLFELSNNSVWRTQFGFNQVPTPLPEWMNVEQDTPQTLTEWGWLNYGFEMYYALLNCGFRLTPTAGTASGVHPVPLGYSRVYVHTGPQFDLDSWLNGLKSGRSFVTNGPMLLCTVNAQLPGHRFAFDAIESHTVAVDVEAISSRPLSGIEILVNGRVVHTVAPAPTAAADGTWKTVTRRLVDIDRSSWLAVRCVEPQPDGRRRFAHTAPWHVMIGGKPITPVREQVEYFVSLMEQEVARNREILNTESLAEFEHALNVYRSLLPRSESLPSPAE